LFSAGYIPLTPPFRVDIENADVVLAADDLYLVNLYYAHAAHRAKIPFVLHQLYYGSSLGKYPFFLKFLAINEHLVGRDIIRHSDHILPVSHKAAEHLSRMGVPSQKMTVIPQPVDTHIFKPIENVSEARNALGLRDDDVVLLFVGKLVYYKGVEELLRAFQMLAKLFPNAKLLIVGNGPLSEYVTSTVRAVHLHDRVLLVKKVEHADMIKIYNVCDILVAPSYIEPFGRACLEGLACGNPLIVTSVGGLQEIVTDGCNGFIVPPKDHVRLHESLCKLVGDADLRAQFGQRSRKMAEETFSVEKIGRQLNMILERVVQQHR
jgi:glycosyltransferase involved in cell wall biosynthesis